MPRKHPAMPHSILGDLQSPGAAPRQYEDTDPQMLFALWEMESGVDPDRSLDEIEGATVIYDKFRPGVSRRKT